MFGLLQALVDLVFPPRSGCILCGQAGKEDICFNCIKWLTNWSKGPKCNICGRPLTNVKRVADCYECKSQKPPFAMARAAGSYEANLRSAIQLLKFKNRKSLAPVLGNLILQMIKQTPAFNQCEIILPVPMSRGRLRERGYNQAELLASEVSRGLGIPMLTNVVAKNMETSPQMGLTREQRRQNLIGAFHVIDPSKIKGKTILIIDDVYTTGSTVSIIAETLKAHGAGKIYVATLANATTTHN